MCYSVWGFVYLYPGHAKCLSSDKRIGSTLSFYPYAAQESLRHEKSPNKMKNEKYMAPEAEVLEIAVEQGFAQSQLESPEEGEED